MATGRMDGRIALITGGGTGMGAAIARLFAQEGAKVVIVGRREKPLKETTAKIRNQGYEGDYCCGDVSRLGDIQNAVEITNKAYGPIDALVNCAGIVNRLENPVSMTDEEWSQLIDINLKGVFYTAKCVLQNMIEHKKKGTIVNIGSIAAHRATKGYATYSASKGAVISYTRVIALQYAEYGIRANCVSPGVVNTPMALVDRDNFDSMIPGLNQIHPLGRMGYPEDIAYAVLFLSCYESDWITGQDLIVDGGLTIEG